MTPDPMPSVQLPPICRRVSRRARTTDLSCLLQTYASEQSKRQKLFLRCCKSTNQIKNYIYAIHRLNDEDTPIRFAEWSKNEGTESEAEKKNRQGHLSNEVVRYLEFLAYLRQSRRYCRGGQWSHERKARYNERDHPFPCTTPVLGVIRILIMIPGDLEGQSKRQQTEPMVEGRTYDIWGENIASRVYVGARELTGTQPLFAVQLRLR